MASFAKKSDVAVAKIYQFDAGTELKLEAIDGTMFECSQVYKLSKTGSMAKKDRLLAITTGNQMVLLCRNPTKPGTAITMEVHELAGLDKLRFKRGAAGSLSLLTLFFKSGRDMRFLMKNITECVNSIKAAMERIGIQGSSSQTKKQVKAIETAESFQEQVAELVAEFTENASLNLIQRVMDLLRQATEKFSEANDERYASAVQSIQLFLRREDVLMFLDASTPMKPNKTNTVAGTEVVLEETTSCIPPKPLDFDLDDETQLSSMERAMLQAFEEDVEDEDMSPLGISPLKDHGSPEDSIESELHSMLGDMTNEFDSLLNSFSMIEGAGEDGES